MTVKEKYQAVLNLGETMQVKDGYVKEEGGTLKFGGLVEYAHDKNRLWDKIKEIGGAAPSDLEANINYNCKDCFAKHTVKSGDTLFTIAEHYYGKGHGMKYKDIHTSNQAVIGDNADVIKPGQEFDIPFPA
jgi:hypothetical protein